MLCLGFLLGYAMSRQAVHVRWPHGLEIHVPTVKDAGALMSLLNATAADAVQKQAMMGGLSAKVAEEVRKVVRQ